jgi:serine/threonine protein kinase
VAIKQFRQRRPQGLVEARIAARIQHPNVVTLHDVLPTGDLVMEYRGGPTLATRPAAARRPAGSARGRSLHCDVKPANLLVGDDGRLVLIDFGIAEIDGATPDHLARRSGYGVGSPVYG